MSRVLPGVQSIDRLRELLAEDEETREWLTHLDEIGPPTVPIKLPRPDDAAPVFLDLAVPHDEVDKLVWLMPDPERTPGIWWLLERATHSLIRTIGEIPQPPRFPTLPRALGELRRYFYFYVLLAARPHTVAYHQSLGISADMSRHTLVDIGRKMSVHRKNYGKGGIDAPGWLTHHMQGQLYALGRLQFERVLLESDERISAGIREAGLPIEPGEIALSVHITDFSGPLSPAACDASIASAKPFFDRFFPDTPVRYALCHSWMLDTQLDHYLHEGSNIIQFKNRFRQAGIAEPNNRSTLQFVFGMLDADIDELPQATSLERAVVAHIVNGHDWRGGSGWFVLPEPESAK